MLNFDFTFRFFQKVHVQESGNEGTISRAIFGAMAIGDSSIVLIA